MAFKPQGKHFAPGTRASEYMSDTIRDYSQYCNKLHPYIKNHKMYIKLRRVNCLSSRDKEHKLLSYLHPMKNEEQAINTSSNSLCFAYFSGQFKKISRFLNMEYCCFLLPKIRAEQWRNFLHSYIIKKL